MLAPCGPLRDLPAETAIRSTITQIYEGTNQIQRMVMARQLLRG
jgi:alkylation response protein AidB-like acyl-CoA dehydrogenase